MTRVRAFQFVVAAATLLCVVWYLLVFLPPSYLSLEAQSVLPAHGADGLSILREPWFYNTTFAARLVAGLALFTFRWWGRPLLLVLLASDLCTVLLGGIAVTPPIDQFVYVLMYLCEGAVVALSYSAPLAHVFQGQRSPESANEG